MSVVINFLIDLLAFCVVSTVLYQHGIDYHSGTYWAAMLMLPLVAINNYYYGKHMETQRPFI